jgi:hypothetical protein
MHLNLTDEETAALTKELHDYRRERPLPPVTSHPHPEGDPREAKTRAGPRALAAAEGVCTAIERPIPETWLDDAQPSMMELVAAPPPPVGKSIPSEAVKNGGRRRHWLDYAGVAGFASIAASFAAGFKINLISRLRSRPRDD